MIRDRTRLNDERRSIARQNAQAADWTDERIERLRELWAKGLTAPEIAVALGGGVTRCSILGKVHRLGLPHRAPGKKAQKSPKAKPAPRVARKPRGSKTAALERGIALRLNRMQHYPFIASAPIWTNNDAWEPLAGTIPVPLLELRRDSCRWPVGGSSKTPATGFCGCAAVEGKSYCPEHHARSVGRGTQSEQEAIKVAETVARVAA